MNKLSRIAFYVSLIFLMAVTLHAAEKPNILFILVDDMGYSDLGCYGGEIETPNLDGLAKNGLRFTQMYNTAKCMTSRACLLTGVYAQQCGMGSGPRPIKNAVTLGEVLRTVGYRTLASGKHHGTENLFERGFDHYYGLRDGACNMWNPGEKRDGEPAPGNKGRVRYWCDDEKTYAPYTPEDRNFYITDAFTDKPLQWLDEKELDDQPFFLYLAYTAPHYPLHAWPKDIAKYEGRYDAGYGAIQKERYKRMVDLGLIDPDKTPFTPMADAAWSHLNGVELAKEKKRMEIYAAMLDCVDQNIGRILEKLKKQGKLDNTLIMFASDNGACAEETGAKRNSTQLEDFGTVASYEAVGENWATVQNTPLRNWKNYTHEGGIRTPFIVSWPGGIKETGGFNHEPLHLIDIMATLVDLTGASYPETFKDEKITPMLGVSLLPTFNGETLERDNPIFWQWSLGGGVREGNWKAVFWDEQWELHDMSKNHNETADQSKKMPERLQSMKQKYEQWSEEVQ